MKTSTNTIEEHLKRYGWDYEKANETLLVTGFRGQTGTFRLFVQNTEDWIIFAISPFTPQPDPTCRERLCKFLLRLNDEMNLAKIGIDEDGDTVLSVEMRSRDFHYEDLAEALDAISFYADEYYLVITNIAVDLNYNPSVNINLDFWET